MNRAILIKALDRIYLAVAWGGDEKSAHIRRIIADAKAKAKVSP